MSTTSVNPEAPYRPRLANYKGKYPNYTLEREDGILTVTFHDGDGDSMTWNWDTHMQAGFLFADIAGDPDNRVIIFTGIGDTCVAADNVEPGSLEAKAWKDGIANGHRLKFNLLNIEAPIISAVNGDLFAHPEVFLMSDINLAAEEARFRTRHIQLGLVPGDGVHVWWPYAIGINRARYFMLTAQTLTAQDMKDFGVVNEVLPRDQVLERANEHARYLLSRPPLAVHWARTTMTRELRRLFESHFLAGMSLEALGSTESWFEADAAEVWS